MSDMVVSQNRGTPIKTQSIIIPIIIIGTPKKTPVSLGNPHTNPAFTEF